VVLLRQGFRGLIVSRHLRSLSRRSRDAAAVARRRVRTRRADNGASLIEVIVAVVLLAIISIPVARFVVQTGTSASQSRLRVEATNVAETEIESLQNLASFGNILSGQQTLAPVTVAQNGGTHAETFYATATYTLQPDSGDTGDSVCALADGSPLPPEIWNVIVTVDWKNSGGVVEGSVTEGTFLAPEAGGAIPATSGELAVPVVSDVSGTPTPYTATAVPISVVGSWIGPGSQPTIPSTEVVAATGNTGNTGCAVFPNLDPATGWQYEVCVGTTATCPVPAASAYTSLVTSQELPGIVNGAFATVPAFSEGPINLSFGTATVPTAISVDPGVNFAVSFVTQCPGPVGTNGTCLYNLSAAGGGSTAPAAAIDLPVTVYESPQLTGANNTFSFDTQAVPRQITSITLYPGNGYNCWAGDTPDSAPTYPDYSGLSATSCNTATPSASLPVYPVVIAATYSGSGFTSVPTVTATEYLGPNETIALNALSPAKSTGVSATGLPLGQYQLGYETTGSNNLINEWIWVTPSGVYHSTAAYTSGPSGTPASPGTAISVTL
jgi:hypothetical protein